MKRSTILAPLFFVFMLIEKAHAETNIDLTQIPSLLADKTGLPVFACGLIVSAICILIPVLIIGMLAGKSKYAWIGETFLCFIISGALISIGWLPAWILIVGSLIVSFAFAEKFAKIIIRG